MIFLGSLVINHILYYLYDLPCTHLANRISLINQHFRLTLTENAKLPLSKDPLYKVSWVLC